MRASYQEEVEEAFDALDAALDRALDLDFAALTTRECLALLVRCERVRRRLPAVEHPLVHAVAEQAGQADPTGPGVKPAWVLADRLLITRGEARRRIAEAADLQPRKMLTGQELQPALPAVAIAQRRGVLGGDHIRVIRGFFEHLPGGVDPGTGAMAEAQLVDLGTQFRPDQLGKLALKLFDCLVPDGIVDAAERTRRRGLVLGRQDRDGMSHVTGWLTPEARASLDAVLARWAAPGMCNPEDDIPCTDGTPSQAALDADTRGTAHRAHDAVVTMCRAMLASGQLGTHNGLPATIIVSTSLTDLHNAAGNAGAGKATTGGGTWLPIRDLIRLARHAHHYLRIFDGAEELALFHTKRRATPGQRIVLHARDRGCSHPGCDVPGYLTEVHHVIGHATCGDTGIDNLTFACGPHHRLIKPDGWQTFRRANGDTEWRPPPHADHGQPRINRYHHPERLLCETAAAANAHHP